MIFATPWGLLALLAIPGIVAIHLFRRRFPVRPVAGLFLWQVVRQTPVRSAAGFRIIAGKEKIGALNLFSDRVGGISERSADQAILLAAFASVAVSALHSKEEARTLAAGLESNREIGKAIGLLMAFHKISDDAAFDLLRKASQDMNIKLAEVAREVVAHHNAGRSTPRIG